MRLRSVLLVVFVLLTAIGCDNRPDNVMSRRKMKRVLYDYHKTQGMRMMMRADERPSEQECLDALYAKHGITAAEFDSSLVWYNAHAEVLKEIYSELKQEITAEHEALQLQTGSNEMAAIITNNNDTTNIWTGSKVIVLRHRDLLNLEQFTMKADTSFRPHDRLRLYASANLKHEGDYSGEYALTMGIIVRGTDGKVVSKVETVTASATRQLEVTQNTDAPIESVSGFFYYKGKPNTKNLCIIDNIALVRMHVPQDSVMVAVSDTLATDTLQTDSTPAPSQHKQQPRLTPQEQLEQQQPKKNIKIKNAPDVRTPNSIGPRRRRPMQGQQQQRPTTSTRNATRQ